MAHGREPADSEVTDALAFLAAYRKKLAALPQSPPDESLEAWAGLARVLLTGNAFLYVD
jgi:hypothetical protein